MGRLEEAEGDAEICRDLRTKIFINPNDVKPQYHKAPVCLQALMNAWADGLHYYQSELVLCSRQGTSDRIFDSVARSAFFAIKPDLPKLAQSIAGRQSPRSVSMGSTDAAWRAGT
jgi:hypothetical protein